ncbi:MAG: efflux RND transporter periplasmic adaptor subunit [Flavobacteriaceae bacterium]|nr:efflux RND transporter periplasmic adaptor subunit [Flavobacteriaceae bacterium]
MKKYIIYIGILAIGILLGWLLFGDSSNTETIHSQNEVSEKKQMWTCSMHPQIMQPEAGDCPICGMDLIPAEAGADGLAADQFKLTKNAMALANIQTSIVGNSTTEDNTIKLSGKIIENEEANTVQVSYFSGRIERLNIGFTGEKVKKGQLLATIYSPELFAAQQELITASSLKESQPELYKAVRNKLKLWKLSEKQINQIEKSEKVKENFPVYATVSGTVSEKLVEQGEAIKQGQPLLKIANLNTVWASFDVYENQIDLFKKGQDISIKTNAYPNKEFKAKVSFIDPVLNTRTRTVKLRAILNNSTNEFKPGMFVEGNIETAKLSEKQAVSIPSTAILWTGKRSVVYIKSTPNEPVFEMREVTLGNAIGENYEVLEGLTNGDEIVVNGTFTVDAAAQLRGKKSMMNNHEKTEADKSEAKNKDVKRLTVSPKFQEQLRLVFNDYINLKDALIIDDSKTVMTNANTILKNLGKVNMKLLTKTKAHNHWMQLEKVIHTSASSIKQTSDIKEQRNHFKELSSHLIIAIKTFGINKKVYHQFCPMADDNKGAYWLSKEKQVLNPYFGDVMLKCGEVKETIE